MDRLRISTRLNLLIAGLLVLIATVAGNGLAGLARADDALQAVFEGSVLPMASVAEIQERLLRNRLAVAVALVTPDEATITRSVGEVEGNIAAIDRLWRDFQASPLNAEQRALAEQFAEHRRAFVREGLLPVVSALKQRDVERANALVVQALRPRYVPVGEDIQRLMQLLLHSARQEHAQALERYAGIRSQSLGLGIGAALVALALGQLLIRSLGRALQSAIEVAESVARGDLSQAVAVRGSPEIARLLASLERMRSSLAALVAGVRRDAEGVASASAQIAQGNSDLSSRTEEQAAALEQTAASMAQLDSAVKQNTSNARQADALAQSASRVASRGGDMVGEVVQTMQGINESARRIGEIISVIDGLAFQTNILALNAAVEAARAGEQGRGFAVVAGEVRMLAQHSAQAAREIKDLVLGSLERVDRGSALVAETGAAVGELVQAIHQVSAAVGGISVASHQQSEGVAQIGEAVNEMDRATQHNAALVEETAAAAASLRQQAQQLVLAVASFHLETEERAGLAGG